MKTVKEIMTTVSRTAITDFPVKKLRLCVDLDGVICEYDFPKIVKNFFKVDLSEQAIFAYDLADVLGVAPILIDNMFHEQVYGKPHFILGALNALYEWKYAGYEITIFSNRVKYMGEKGLAMWLVDNAIPFRKIDGGKDEYDVHIDDSPAKLMATNSKLKLLYSQPWNEKCLNITGELVRVHNWREVRNHVSALLEAGQ